MRSLRSTHLATLGAALVVLGTTQYGSESINPATETVRYKDSGSIRAPGLQLILEDAFSYEPFVGTLTDSPSATFEVTYTGFTPQARAAFDFALNIWASLLSSPVPIKVTANFQVLSGNTLAQAGAANAWRNFPGRTAQQYVVYRRDCGQTPWRERE